MKYFDKTIKDTRRNTKCLCAFTLQNKAAPETDFNSRSSYSTFKKNGNLNVRFIMLKGEVNANLTTRNKKLLVLGLTATRSNHIAPYLEILNSNILITASHYLQMTCH